MKACGLIVEYNPFHNGHLYHIQKAKEISQADCIIAVMSGAFLQRGEPAIIDKFHRTKAALASGVDIVLELPYLYAVQSSDYFAYGAVNTLNEIGVESICFGSESGSITNLIASYKHYKGKESVYKEKLKQYLDEGMSFPDASQLAYRAIGLTDTAIDLKKPNNILGFSYIKAIMDNHLSIEPLTVERIQSNFHDKDITTSIASATSIRKKLFETDAILEQVKQTMPNETVRQLQRYKETAGLWHTWENYFPLLHYRVMTMSSKELQKIAGVDEGLENRLKKTAKDITTFKDWMHAIKTKRYTWTRLQRMFVHLLTNTKKSDLALIKQPSSVPYIRLLGLTQTGQTYLNKRKKDIAVPIVHKLGKDISLMLKIDERASDAYYSILTPTLRYKYRQQERHGPIRLL